MEEIKSKYSLDIEETIANLKAVGDRLGAVQDVVDKQTRTKPFAQAAQSGVQYNQVLGQQATAYQRIQALENALQTQHKQHQAQIKALQTEYGELKKKQAAFLAAGDYQALKTKLGEVTTKLEQMGAPIQKTESIWDRLKAKFSKGISVPKVDMPETGGNGGRDSNGRFLPGAGGNGGSGGKKEKGGTGTEILNSVIEEIGDKAGINLSGGQLAAGAAVAAVAGVVVKATKDWAEYGKKLSEVSALTGVTGKDLEALSRKALEMEGTTGIAATEILEGFKTVGGIKAELLENTADLTKVTDDVIALSQASGETLADSATVAVGALNQFGEAAGQSGRFVNVLAAGAKVGASEVRDTGEALKVSGTAMKAAGLSFEQGNALIQSLAGVMIKGSEAGTALRNVILKLETDTDKKLRPSVVGLDAALEAAAGKYKTTTDLTKVFGQENIVAARRILDTRGEITKLTTDLTGTNTAYEQQRINLDNLSTDLTKASTAITALFRSMGQANDGFIRGVVRGFTQFLGLLSNSKSTLRTFFSSLTDGEGGVLSAFRDAYAQSQANDAARKSAAEVGGIVKATTDRVKGTTPTKDGERAKGEIEILADLYKKRGETEPVALRKASQAIKKQYDTEYSEAVQHHARLRKEYEKSGKDQKDYFDKQFDASRRRLLVARTAKKLADKQVEQLAKDDAERAENLASALGEKSSDADKKAGKKAQKVREDNYKLLLSAQEEYTKEYQKLEEEFGKQRLEALKADENKYLEEKASLDKKEVDAEEAHLLKLLQLAASNKTKINKLTGQREVVADQSVVLPADIKAAFDARRTEIDNEANRKIRLNRIRQEYEILQLARQTNQTELQLFDKYWEEKLAVEEKGAEKYAEMVRQRDGARVDYVKKGNQDELNEYDDKWEKLLAAEEKNAKKYAALVRKRDADRNDLMFDQIIRDQRAIETIANYNVDLRNKPGTTTGTRFNKDNELDKVANSIYSSETQIEALRAQANPANAPEILRLEAYVKALKEKRKEIQILGPANRDIWDVLGISKSFMDETERQVFLQGVDLITSAIRTATEEAVQAADARIQALDAEISAKEEQVRTEEERSKEGYANNLLVRQAELEDLKRQKAEEQAVRRRALAVQQSLDLAAQVSNNAVTVSNTVTAISEMFKQYGKIPLVGIFLALGAVATIIGTIASVKAKARAITQLRQGGRIPRDGRTHEQGGHRIEGTDIEVERDEWVTNARSSEKYNDVLDAINKDSPQKAFQAMLQHVQFGLPQSVVHYIQHPDFGRASTANFSGMERAISGLDTRLASIERNTKPTKPGKQIHPLGDGTWLEVDGNHVTHRKP